MHVYNNFYRITDTGFQYALGAGNESAIYAQNNAFELDDGVSAAKIVKNYGGTVLHAEGSLVNGVDTDIVALYNAAKPTLALGDDVGWTPSLHRRIEPAALVEAQVTANAGVGHLHK